MLQVKHSEEALGGSDNMAPSPGPEGYLLDHGAFPSSTCVLNKQGFFPQARLGPGQAGATTGTMTGL